MPLDPGVHVPVRVPRRLVELGCRRPRVVATEREPCICFCLVSGTSDEAAGRDEADSRLEALMGGFGECSGVMSGWCLEDLEMLMCKACVVSGDLRLDESRDVKACCGKFNDWQAMDFIADLGHL